MQPSPLQPLAEQVVVVIGASSGIGRATALRAASAGADVVAVARDGVALASLAAAAGPGRVVTVTADVADPDAVESVARRAVEELGRIDTWAHVAGTSVHGPFAAITPEEFRRVVEVDLLGVAWGARAALPHLRRRGGALVVVSSAIARQPFPFATPYSAAKRGVDGFLRALRMELRGERPAVSVVQVLPAAVDTPFFDHARTRLGVRASAPPPVVAPERVADAVLRAAVAGGPDCTVGSAAKGVTVLGRISPRLADAVTGPLASWLGRSSEPKAPGEDTLDLRPSGDDRVRGPVSNVHR